MNAKQQALYSSILATDHAILRLTAPDSATHMITVFRNPTASQFRVALTYGRSDMMGPAWATSTEHALQNPQSLPLVWQRESVLSALVAGKLFATQAWTLAEESDKTLIAYCEACVD